MIFFGHIGFTVGTVRALSHKTDLRKAAILSLGPDLLDKPLALLYPNVFRNHTRLIGHSLLFSLVVLVAILIQRRFDRRIGAALWLAFSGHMLLDKMWEKNLNALLWPLYGPLPLLEKPIFQRWHESIFIPYNLFGELVGLAILLGLALKYRLYDGQRYRSFLKTGLLK